MSDVPMPRLSDTMEEGTIGHWLKKPGDEIKKGDILAEIETDKATMDLEAYEAGTLQEILVQEGETVPIGQAVARIGSGAAPAQPAPAPAPAAVKTGANGTGAAPTQAASASAEKASPANKRAVLAGNGERGAVKSSPLARRMAEEHGIDLREVQGTGPNGRIVRDDIEDVLEQRGPAPQEGTPAPAAPAAPSEPATKAAAPPHPQEVPAPAAPPSTSPSETEVTKLSRVRMLIARRLSESKQTIPHFYVSSEVDMTDLLALRQTLNADSGADGVKVTVNDLIVKACALALETFPEVNSSIKDDALITYKHINVGFAVDVPTGLVVPVIRETNSKGVRSIAREAKALIAKARANKLAPGDLEGGTFSVSNLGMMDASTFIAVINAPQAAILAVAATRKQFVPVDGQPVVRDLMQMTLSADHRILYGATVARFLQEVKRLLQTPFSLLG
jgi:pyruvate dehydrogenase E2 component (dihydrolipoamide acetyltransferase)